MNRKTVYLILIALAVVLLVVLLWWWFLRRESTAVQTTGTFGTAQNTQNTGSTNGSTGSTNVASNVNGQPSTQANTSAGTAQTNIQLGTVGTTGAVGTQTGVSQTGQPVTIGQVGVPGVIWLSGTPTTPSTNPSTSNNPGTVFNPTAINDVVDSNPSGTGLIPNIGTNGQQVTESGSGGLGAAGTAAITAAAGAVSCGAAQALQALGIGTGAGVSAGGGLAGLGASTVASAPSVSTSDIGTHSQLTIGFTALAGLSTSQLGLAQARGNIDDFWGCIARTVAKVALNQITNSVVNWINSGFNGSPSFVQNPTAFFQQTADQAAGAFIQSSALSFLCSPFQLQIKIAIAQSYANRNAGSCTLTQVTTNIQNFMNGNFLSGNWAGMLSFTNVPTNNPYGAFLYGSIGLTAATNAAVGQKQTDLLQGGGFLSFQQKQNCHNVSEDQLSGNNVGPNKTFTQLPNAVQPGQAPQYSVCDLVTTTPGHVIADALGATNSSTFNELDVAKSFDEIISALITQLVTRTLQGGLSNLSGAGGYSSNFYSSDQLQAQSSAQTLLTQMQTDSSNATQYANVEQGSISDIEDAQSRLNDLYNCWAGVATSSASAGQASSNAAQASSTLASLNTTIDSYNGRITLANNAIVVLEQLQSRVLSAQSTSDISSITSDYSSAQAAGTIPTQDDVTNAQQNRTTLQSQMSALNAQTSAGLQQCNAF